jgi:S-DNA-T family DNA segregation ATPase FtsK/SpoIIIE
MNKRQQLEWQSNRIEATLAQYGLAGYVTGGVIAPRWIQFQVEPGPRTRVRQIRDLAEELALTLRADTCRVARKNGLVTVEVPRPDPRPIHLLPLQRKIKDIPLGAATLGLADDGSPLLIRLSSSQVAHVLIAGTTGSGKSALACTMIASLALRHRRNELSLVLIDPKRRAFGPLAGLPHLVQPVIVQPDQAAATLAQLVQLMLERDQQGISTPRVVVVIDELADLLMVAGKAARESITRLAQRGREAGLHLIACTQKPTNKAVDSLAKANFPVRLVGQVTSPEEAKIATGYAGTGAERLRGPGDFIAVTGGQITRFQAAYVTASQMDTLVQKLALQAGAHRAIQLPQQQAPSTRENSFDLDHWVAEIRPIWPDLLESGGKLRWGAKADIAQKIFGKRSTAGWFGEKVDDVIAALRAETTTTFAQTVPFAVRQTVLSPRVEGKNTTTTPITILRRAFSRFVGRVWVVVAFDGPRYRTFSLPLPRLWGAARLVVAWKHDDRWIIERIH